MRHSILFVLALSLIGNVAMAADLQVGDEITMGHFEQDNNKKNGADPIEWQVIQRHNEWALLVTKYGIDNRVFQKKGKEIKWENSLLRKWLAEEFFVNSFNEQEKEAIGFTNNINSENPQYKTAGGEKTMDQVFVLSIDQARYLIQDKEARRVMPSIFAVVQGARHEDSKCSWWLRSPGDEANKIAVVKPDGKVNYIGISSKEKAVVRPAMWVDINKI